MKKEVLLYVRTSENAYIPTLGTPGSSGFDIKASSDFTLYPIPTSNNIIPTNLIVIIPEGHYGRIAPRSGLALKMIDVGGGVIDKDYRGEIGIIMYNYSDKPYHIKRGDKIAQLIIEKISVPELVEINKEVLDNFQTTRGANGFSSTGV